MEYKDEFGDYIYTFPRPENVKLLAVWQDLEGVKYIEEIGDYKGIGDIPWHELPKHHELEIDGERIPRAYIAFVYEYADGTRGPVPDEEIPLSLPDRDLVDLETAAKVSGFAEQEIISAANDQILTRVGSLFYLPELMYWAGKAKPNSDERETKRQKRKRGRKARRGK